MQKACCFAREQAPSCLSRRKTFCKAKPYLQAFNRPVNRKIMYISMIGNSYHSRARGGPAANFPIPVSQGQAPVPALPRISRQARTRAATGGRPYDHPRRGRPPCLPFFGPCACLGMRRADTGLPLRRKGCRRIFYPAPALEKTTKWRPRRISGVLGRTRKGRQRKARWPVMAAGFRLLWMLMN